MTYYKIWDVKGLRHNIQDKSICLPIAMVMFSVKGSHCEGANFSPLRILLMGGVTHIFGNQFKFLRIYILVRFFQNPKSWARKREKKQMGWLVLCAEGISKWLAKREDRKERAHTGLSREAHCLSGTRISHNPRLPKGGKQGESVTGQVKTTFTGIRPGRHRCGTGNSRMFLAVL